MIEAASFFDYLYRPIAIQKEQAVFEPAYDLQKQRLIRFHSQCWDRLAAIVQLEANNYGLWLQSCLYTGEDFRMLLNIGAINAEDPHDLLWGFYANLIHKTNNRLGLEKADEPFLYYVMMRTLEEISSNNEPRMTDWD